MRNERATPSPSLAERLRVLSVRVERLGVSGRTTPEDIIVEKLTVARAMRRLAAEAER